MLKSLSKKKGLPIERGGAALGSVVGDRIFSGALAQREPISWEGSEGRGTLGEMLFERRAPFLHRGGRAPLEKGATTQRGKRMPGRGTIAWKWGHPYFETDALRGESE